MLLKGNEFFHKLKCFYPYIFKPRRRKPLIFKTTNCVMSKSPSLKCGRFTSSDFKDMGIRKPKLNSFVFNLKTSLYFLLISYYLSCTSILVLKTILIKFYNLKFTLNCYFYHPPHFSCCMGICTNVL